MLLALFLFGVLAGFMFQKNRIVTAYNAIIMWIITGWQYKTADWWNYNFIFLDGTEKISLTFLGQPLYYILNLLIGKFTQDVKYIYIICGAFAIILLIKAIKAYTERINLALSFFMITVFLLYAVQIRNFVALPILLFSIQFLMPDKYNLTKFVFCIVLASGFHISFMFYLLLVLIPFLNKWHSLLFLLFTSFFILIFQRYFGFLFLYFGMNNYSLTQSGDRTVLIYNLLTLIMLLLVLTAVYLISSFNKSIPSHNRDIAVIDSISNSTFSDKTINFFIKLIMFMFVCIPLNMVTVESVRLSRNLFPLFFCIFAKIHLHGWSFNYHKVRTKRILSTFFFTLVIAYCFVYSNLFIYRQCYETVFIALFENNLLFN